MLRHATVSLFLPTLEGGGAERAMLHLAEGFTACGLKTDLILAQAKGKYLSMVPDGIRVIDLQAHAPVLLRKTLALQRYLRRERPAVLLTTLDIVNAAAWARRMAGVPTRVVMVVQTNLSAQFRDYTDGTGWLRPQLVRWFYPWADQIITASQGVAEDLAQISGLPLGEMRVIYNPVVTPRFLQMVQQPVPHPWFAAGQPPVILGVGRLVRQKDFPTLIRSFAQIRPQVPARLVILGEGEERANLEFLVRQLGLTDAVDLPGFVENPYAYMAQASVFALSSTHEGFGNVVAEALGAGTAVVSTDCPSGPAEILGWGRYGTLTPVGDARALAQGIVRTLQKPPGSEGLRQRARAFSLMAIVEQYCEVLEKLMQQPKAGWR
ncbi:glycosyltransferase [Anthocerotibacter panamensis]|uniref:glycosyltransferase n=1 Tax=Anthocerotibacter panamensis TaxID=2857077 RepID=UPI001C405B89|nr:glycosyltransferase [Anthocerotibacter panamensis]